MEDFVTYLAAIIISVLVSCVLAFFVMLLWNWLMPMIFGLMVLNYWQAVGVTILCNLLFKSTSSSSK